MKRLNFSSLLTPAFPTIADKVAIRAAEQLRDQAQQQQRQVEQMTRRINAMATLTPLPDAVHPDQAED